MTGRYHSIESHLSVTKTIRLWFVIALITNTRVGRKLGNLIRFIVRMQILYILNAVSFLSVLCIIYTAYATWHLDIEIIFEMENQVIISCSLKQQARRASVLTVVFMTFPLYISSSLFMN
jgi:hypothetical protein